MARYIDLILLWLKWPTAIFLLLSVPALVHSFDYFNFMAPKFYALAGGIGFYVLMIIVTGYNTCHTMQIISHELTHTFFAYLTFHDAGRIRLNPDGSGGSMILKGRGNWIITLSPYFFPLFAFFYMLLMPMFLRLSNNHWLVYGVFGFFVAYYWATVIEQVHPKQTDIKKEGYIFSIIVIVAANLYTSGIMLAFCSKSWEGVKIYLALIYRLSMTYGAEILKSATQYFQ
ncbi:MAG: M50 family metallopeptidase [Alphaproteobacteria bacterium]|nr:M50 family metallopeptidase [Alphaproteobacteria bacterium]